MLRALEGVAGTPAAPASLYVHVPFCFHKCHYCDFYSFVDKANQQDAFVAALRKELALLGPLSRGRAFGGLRTVFIGGGTPSLLRVDLWERLLEALHTHFDMPADEFTVECNPETVTPELMRTLKGGGVTRVSIGAQSFDPANLKALERWHDPANVARAVRMAADAGIQRRSIDMIFAVPGQRVEDWDMDLSRAIEIADAAPGLEHLSCYNLTYEPNTAMTRRLEKGEFAPVPEDDEAAMFRLTRSRLADHGFEAYEVSNFARGGAARCRHNLAYWRQEPWLAAGPSASAHAAGWRWKNAGSLGEWMRHVEANGGLAPVTDIEPPEPRRALSERLMTGLRLIEGVDAASALSDAEALGVARGLRDAADRVARKGLLMEAGGRWTLTEVGVLVGDSIAAELMAGLRA